MKKCKVTEHLAPQDKKVGNFGIASFADIADVVVEYSDEILNASKHNSTFYLPDTSYKISASSHLHENGFVIDLVEATDTGVYKYDDAGKAAMYIFEDEIIYVVTEVDFRLNEEPNVNQERVEELEHRIGKQINIPSRLAKPKHNASDITLAVFRKKKQLFSSKQQIADLKKQVYFSKLQHVVDLLNVERLQGKINN